MNELALFAGAGGGILGGLLHGWRTVAAVEIEDYPRRVLLQRQADGILPRFPIWDDVCTFDGTEWKGKVDVISGGFPCQDISCAGKGAGLEGARSGLWSEFARIIGEVGPQYVFVENSPMLVIRGLDRVLGDLTEMGYDCRWGVLGADDAGAPHQRKRIWLLGRNSNHVRCVGDGREIGEVQNQNADTNRICQDVAYPTGGQSGQQATRNRRKSVIRGSEDVADARSYSARTAKELRPQEQNTIGEDARNSRCTWWDADPADLADAAMFYAQGRVDGQGKEQFGRSYQREGEHDQDGPTQPVMGRVAHGVAHRVDRLKAIGNGQVPAVAALAWEVLGGPDRAVVVRS